MATFILANQERWENIHPGRNPPRRIAARRGPLSGLILCLDRAVGVDYAVVAVFVTGDGVADGERGRLHYYMSA